MQSGAGILKSEKQFRSESCTRYGCGNGGPAKGSDDGISKAAAECEVDAERYNLGEGFEEEVGMDSVGAEMQIDRKCDRKMRGREDEEL